MPFDSDSARAAAQLSAEARRAKPNDPLARARAALSEDVSSVADELVAAALGERGFSDLRPEVRLKAILAVLEYTLGKPRVASEPEEPESAPFDPSALFARAAESQETA